MRTAIITVASGRHRHLQRQQAAIADIAGPRLYVVVAMGDRAIGTISRDGPVAQSAVDTALTLVELPADRDELPLAQARNAGAAAAIEEGSDLLIFLDVDCIPSARLVTGYHRAADRLASHEAISLLCGPVTYLAPPACPGGEYPRDLSPLYSPHPARPAPAEGEILQAEGMRLFWSLSFAITTRDWIRAGGFDESYTGYGAEDTDFAQTVASLGGRMFWVGGADAYHQWHPVCEPPVEHLDAILRNANAFRRKWGWTPMEGWLEAFAAEGLAYRRPRDGAWRRSPASG